MNASPPRVNRTAPRYCDQAAGWQVGQRVGAGDDVANRAESEGQRRLLAVRRIGDVVAAEQEAERDQQTARGDERDHVAHAGQQDLPSAGAPADAAGRGRRGGRRARVALHAGRGGIGRGGKRFGDHLVRFVDRAFDAGGDDGLAREPLLVLDADVGGEDDGVGAGDRRRRRSGVLPDDPWVSTCSVAPAFLAAATSESAAM